MDAITTMPVARPYQLWLMNDPGRNGYPLQCWMWDKDGPGKQVKETFDLAMAQESIRKIQLANPGLVYMLLHEPPPNVPYEGTAAQREPVPGPYLRKTAARLLEQLKTNRPRRALDLNATRQLLELVAERLDAEKLIQELIHAAWDWGVSCEIDAVPWGEAGDSHNEMLRDRTMILGTQLQAALLRGTK